jgi:hypothetical protein
MWNPLSVSPLLPPIMLAEIRLGDEVTDTGALLRGLVLLDGTRVAGDLGRSLGLVADRVVEVVCHRSVFVRAGRTNKKNNARMRPRMAFGSMADFTADDESPTSPDRIVFRNLYPRIAVVCATN